MKSSIQYAFYKIIHLIKRKKVYPLKYRVANSGQWASLVKKDKLLVRDLQVVGGDNALNFSVVSVFALHLDYPFQRLAPKIINKILHHCRKICSKNSTCSSLEFNRTLSLNLLSNINISSRAAITGLAKENQASYAISFTFVRPSDTYKKEGEDGNGHIEMMSKIELTDRTVIEMKLKMRKWEMMKEKERLKVFDWIKKLDELDVDTVKYGLECELKSKDDSCATSCQESIEEHRIIHVHPGNKFYNLQCFETINDALDYVKEKRKDTSAPYLIFVHPGTYNEAISIKTDDVALIGVPEKIWKVEESVIIQNEGKVMHVEKNLKCVYVGYLTLQQLNSNHDSSVDDELPASSCLQMAEGSSPTFEHCLIMNATNKGATVYVGVMAAPTICRCIIRNSHICSAAIHVSGEGASPIVKNCNIFYYNTSYCDISHDKNIGIYRTDNAGEMWPYDSKFNKKSGIWIEGNEALILYQNHIRHKCYPIGIYLSNRASGHFENNDIHRNGTGFMITGSMNPTIRENNIYGCQNGIHIFDNSSGLIEENKVHHNERIGINILNSKVEFRKNKIYRNCQGVSFQDGNQNLIKENKVMANTSANFLIMSDFMRLLRRDEICNE